MLKNIVATISSMASEAAGPSYSVRRLYEELSKNGHDVTLLDADKVTGINNKLSFGKSFVRGTGPAKLCLSPQMNKYLNTRAKTKQISLLHNHGLWMMPNVYPGQVAKKFNIPLVTSPRGTFAAPAWNSGSKVKKIFWPLIQKPALDATVCFHATAESEYEDIRRFGYKQPVAIIPNGIDIPAEFVKQPSQMKTLLFLGRIHPIKGLDMLLPSWQKLQYEFLDWQLKIVGPDSRGHLADMQKLAQQLKLQRIIFTGALYQIEKWQEYHNADLFVLPTYSENFAMSVAESLASKVPVVVTKGAPWQILEQNNAGLWVDINKNSLYDGLHRMMRKSSAELMEMGKVGHQLMVDEFSWRKVSLMMSELYAWILDGGLKPKFVRLD